jgi:hypothetical protein
MSLWDLSCSLNSSSENLMGHENLGCFEFSKSLFLIFENDVQILNILLLFLELIF